MKKAKLFKFTFLTAILSLSYASTFAQDTVEWTTLGNDFAHTRFSPADQITVENFEDLEVAWEWDGSSFQAQSGRSTPSYINGRMYTVAGSRRHVVAIDPKTGETIWSYREPNTERYQYSMRADYGKGVGYGRVDGKDIIYIISPGFFLTALDAETGAPLEGFGKPVPIEGFPDTGVVDLIADLGHPYDPFEGIPLERGYITSSSPPIVVNDVVIVGNSAEQGYHQSRIENVPGDLLGYDAKTGEFLWKFNVIPQPGEYGHETWENDAWSYTGDISSWAPISADPDLGLVYVPTNGVTIDYYGGHHPGDNLYGTSLIALNARTGERAWHFQLVHHDIWNFDTPTAPILLDVNTEQGLTPIVAQPTKQGLVYTFNRETGEPIWPIEELPVPASVVPGEKLATTQPFPTKPAAFDMQGLSIDTLVDFTPEIRAQAIAAVADYQLGPVFNPPLHRDNDLGKISALICPSGSVNITHPSVADPTTGILYVASRSGCSARPLVSGEEADTLYDAPTGVTLSRYAAGRGGATPRHPLGIPLWKPPYSRITAIDMNTGEHLWMIPTGETPERISNLPELRGIDIGNTGTGNGVPMVATAEMLLYSDVTADGTPHLFAIDKSSGEEVGRVEVPAASRYGMSSWVHEGRQYVILQTGSSLTAMTLPE
ncbi:MAG: PQQ-binding-like beta-propeller repeat protein [Gammaproteobacteria bacterium]|jgi:quinoprotein glucose dehydrogenase|nr:PQQ-binding-like beta-propeller repeat protein [Gammaproteobacteria bacterium]MBT3860497.1 PQQ-binding-like beta-propeller repeat protein [Gammaproteobacteria bacterium]MBT3987946.1 PQQ-binding-like beta-propeller repeat protein [Gammaproteobacteria bacterium]MBT4254435.1 PQQ-binding-like beta-propeller repeat protein [Gammaproteobacteria bacterium]MBT4582473.1 PQQ-binding-like beta-propeller repeat protein [Gammaproteobacteria bacterium]